MSAFTFARWVATPENRSALLAMQQVADCLVNRRQRRIINPLFLHGPSGTGKTHLVTALVSDLTRRRADVLVNVLSGGDVGGECNRETAGSPGDCDLLVVEDLQHLRSRTSEAFVQWFDDRQARQLQMIFTANAGPGQLRHLPARLTSRLGCGLVVSLAPFAPAGRLAFLADRAQRRQLALGHDVLTWLAEHLDGSGRELEGAITRLESLVRLQNRLPDVETVAQYFREEAEASRPTVERIAQHVSRYYQLEPRHLQSQRRGRNVLLPRQVGMYLARKLTLLSLDQIGAYFGGRDHSTVLHACRKVEQALTHDPTLSGSVRQLHADLA